MTKRPRKAANAVPDDGERAGSGDYDPTANAVHSYNQAMAAIRMQHVRAGTMLPLHDRPDEIKASPIVEAVFHRGGVTLYCGDCTRITPLLAASGPFVDACVTDPPYELGFMGKSWDSTGVAAAWETWGGVRIALKPGAHLAAFAGSRTYHWIAQAIENAGFEVRDQIMWLYGSGFPKSLDVAKSIDKSGGLEGPGARAYRERREADHGPELHAVAKRGGRLR